MNMVVLFEPPEDLSCSYPAHLAFQISLPLWFRELFDGVAEHGAGHLAVAGHRCFTAFSMTVVQNALQIHLQCLPVALSRLAEEPADGFVDQVVRVMKENISNGERVVKLPVPDEGHGGDDADALLPDGLAAAGQIVQDAAVFVQQPHAEQWIAAQVHQVPVVDTVGMGEVEIDAAAAVGFRLRMREDIHQRQQSRQPQLVILAADAALQLLEADVLPARLHN